ncbi:citrate synthase [Microvirga flavescens]|uniref:citrate synthase n=1 Tax=Microvirga flavescens TaxID=2249811 RepID=UPI000DDA709E|nr:citrate synthase [Microvirga flavescens]
MRTTAAPLDLISAPEASHRLGISPASLYAYVSRGLVRSFASPHDPRQRLYAAEDVDALVKRRTRMRRPTVAAATALDWGLPVLQTSITQIKDGQLFYRGVDAASLAAHATLEDVAGLLLGFTLQPSSHRFPAPDTNNPRDFIGNAIRLLSTPASKSETLACETSAILRLVAAASTGSVPKSRPLHEHFRSAWKVAPAAGEAIRRALVLCADHELSASAFAVRVAASTGATLRNSMIAGLAALSGPLHGGATEIVRAFFEECERGKSIDTARIKSAAGFHHPLYPEGDPRGAALIDGLPLREGDRAIMDRIAKASGGQPTIDVALVMVERAFSLPKGAAFVLFGTGRTAGWLAHAIEQRAQGTLIRPRAQYVLSETA